MSEDEILENVFSAEATEELIRLFDDAEAEQSDRNILLDVSTDKSGGVHLQMASVTVDGEEDEDYIVHEHSSGISIYVETKKIKYFKDMQLVVREIDSEEGTEKLIIFAPK